jgi:alpha-glucoside transport system substrate-binding protein
MPIYDRHQRNELDRLVEGYTTNKLNRRQFLKRALAVGLSASAATSLLEACGNSNSGGVNTGGSVPTVKSIDILTEWSGEELDSFNAIAAAFKTKSGISANAGKLLQLDKFFNMTQYQQDYTSGWQSFSSVNGHLYAVIPKANTKGTIWYSPKQFSANGYTIPTDWNSLIALSDKIANSGKYPWAMGVESSGSSGWPGADWIDQIYLNVNGPDLYDQWVAHKIPWTHASIKSAFQMYGQIVNGKHYINGGAQEILATNFQDASYLPFDTPPKAYMYYLGDFTEGFITAQFKGIQAGTDYNFFQFPTLNAQYKGSVTGGADIMSAFKDNNGTRQFMEFMASAEAQSIWVKRGGATSVNKSVPLSDYPSDVARNSATQLSQATNFRVGADDLMPAAMENAYWAGVLKFIQHPDQLDSVLSSLESTASQTYTS